MVRTILLAKGYTPATLAADMGISEGKAKTLLYGKRDILLSDILRIRDALGVSANFLLMEPGVLTERRENEERYRKLEAPA